MGPRTRSRVNKKMVDSDKEPTAAELEVGTMP